MLSDAASLSLRDISPAPAPSPVASGGENGVQDFQLHHLFIGREVAVFISMGAAHNDHVQRKAG